MQEIGISQRDKHTIVHYPCFAAARVVIGEQVRECTDCWLSESRVVGEVGIKVESPVNG